MPDLAPPSPRFRTTPAPCPSLWTLNPMNESVDVDCGHHTSGRMFDPPREILTYSRFVYTVVLQWTWVSSLGDSGPEAETLPGV
ncbi:hypothetical protein AVEN_52471-1 [Araneus ventricosus]|uniref:Uncharacterized protein n=1 Tax=Araneus ventricosus TaxID=182803 RepID=A0A4Y2CXH8_ARAVE|nr:hypothetical protein AVEN_52471-1 [Araneus ventricosus]